MDNKDYKLTSESVTVVGAKVNKVSEVTIKGKTYMVPDIFIGTKIDAVITTTITLHYEDHQIEILAMENESKIDENIQINNVPLNWGNNILEMG